MKCYRIRAAGRVQGVFFRASTKEFADKLGISGWVKNEPDGSVLIEAEGSDESLDRFIDWCKSGPPMSVVEELKYEEIPTQSFKKFRITY